MNNNCKIGIVYFVNEAYDYVESICNLSASHPKENRFSNKFYIRLNRAFIEAQLEQSFLYQLIYSEQNLGEYFKRDASSENNNAEAKGLDSENSECVQDEIVIRCNLSQWTLPAMMYVQEVLGDVQNLVPQVAEIPPDMFNYLNDGTKRKETIEFVAGYLGLQPYHLWFYYNINEKFYVYTRKAKEGVTFHRNSRGLAVHTPSYSWQDKTSYTFPITRMKTPEFIAYITDECCAKQDISIMSLWKQNYDAIEDLYLKFKYLDMHSGKIQKCLTNPDKFDFANHTVRARQEAKMNVLKRIIECETRYAHIIYQFLLSLQERDINSELYIFAFQYALRAIDVSKLDLFKDLLLSRKLRKVQLLSVCQVGWIEAALDCRWVAQNYIENLLPSLVCAVTKSTTLAKKRKLKLLDNESNVKSNGAASLAVKRQKVRRKKSTPLKLFEKEESETRKNVRYGSSGDSSGSSSSGSSDNDESEEDDDSDEQQPRNCKSNMPTEANSSTRVSNGASLDFDRYCKKNTEIIESLPSGVYKGMLYEWIWKAIKSKSTESIKGFMTHFAKFDFIHSVTELAFQLFRLPETECTKSDYWDQIRTKSRDYDYEDALSTIFQNDHLCQKYACQPEFALFALATRDYKSFTISLSVCTNPFELFEMILNKLGFKNENCVFLIRSFEMYNPFWNYQDKTKYTAILETAMCINKIDDDVLCQMIILFEQQKVCTIVDVFAISKRAKKLLPIELAILYRFDTELSLE